MLARIITGISSQVGSLLPSRIMQAAVAMPPMRTCPSAPMSQNRILKAGVTASDTHSSMATFCSRPQIRRWVPTAPSIMVA